MKPTLTDPRADTATTRCLVSVHDVMPETLPAVEQALTELKRLEVPPATLLVVPGRVWTESGLDRLRVLEQQGYKLAAHGWRHQADRLGGLYHHIHSAFLSRRVAEHLALDTDGIIALMRRSRNWFTGHGFATPRLYVPPAWAMGRVPRSRLSAENLFESYELFGGIYHATAHIWQPTPLLGYESDSRLRAPPLRLWNRLNRWLAGRSGRLRIGIHPHDFSYALASDLRADLSRFRHFADYAPPEGLDPAIMSAHGEE